MSTTLTSRLDLANPSTTEAFGVELSCRKQPRKSSSREGPCIDPLPPTFSKYPQIPVNAIILLHFTDHALSLYETSDKKLCLIQSNRPPTPVEVALISHASGVTPSAQRELPSIAPTKVVHPNFQVQWSKAAGNRIQELSCSFPTNDWHEKTIWNIPSRGGGPLFTAFVLCFIIGEPPTEQILEITVKFQVISLKQWGRRNVPCPMRRPDSSKKRIADVAFGVPDHRNFITSSISMESLEDCGRPTKISKCVHCHSSLQAGYEQHIHSWNHSNTYGNRDQIDMYNHTLTPPPPPPIIPPQIDMYNHTLTPPPPPPQISPLAPPQTHLSRPLSPLPPLRMQSSTDSQRCFAPTLYNVPPPTIIPQLTPSFSLSPRIPCAKEQSSTGFKLVKPEARRLVPKPPQAMQKVPVLIDPPPSNLPSFALVHQKNSITSVHM